MYPTGCFNPTMRYGRLPQLRSRFLAFLRRSSKLPSDSPPSSRHEWKDTNRSFRWKMTTETFTNLAFRLSTFFLIWSLKPKILDSWVLCVFFFQVQSRLRIDFFMASSLQPKCEPKPLEWWQVAPLIWGRAIGYFWLQLKGMPPLKLQGLKWICEKWCFFSSWTLLKIATIAACFRRHSEKNAQVSRNSSKFQGTFPANLIARCSEEALPARFSEAEDGRCRVD